MWETAILAAIVMGELLIALAIVGAIKNESQRLDHQFMYQLKMAEAQASASNPMTFDTIKKIVTDIIVNQCIVEVANNGYQEKTDEELSLVINDIILDIATKTEQALAPELIRQWEKFCTEDYRTRFIIFTVKTSLFAQLSSRTVRSLNVRTDTIKNGTTDTNVTRS